MKKPSTVLTRPDSYVKNGMNDCRHLYNSQDTTREDTAKHALKRCGSANKPAILREKTEEAYEGFPDESANADGYRYGSRHRRRGIDPSDGA